MTFTDAGEHELKGVPGAWHLYSGPSALPRNAGSKRGRYLTRPFEESRPTLTTIAARFPTQNTAAVDRLASYHSASWAVRSVDSGTGSMGYRSPTDPLA
jgi:hypothetical protein